MRIERLCPSDYRAMRWSNGLGTTHEIAIERTPSALADTPSGPDFLWRLSLAEVSAAVPFSRFPGVDRTILLLAGAGMLLESSEGGEQRLEQRYQPYCFAGEWQTKCRLLGGPCRDLNLMVDRQRATASVQVLELATAAQSLPAVGAPLLLFTLSGEVTVTIDGHLCPYLLPEHHTMLLHPESSPLPSAVAMARTSSESALLFVASICCSVRGAP